MLRDEAALLDQARSDAVSVVDPEALARGAGPAPGGRLTAGTFTVHGQGDAATLELVRGGSDRPVPVALVVEHDAHRHQPVGSLIGWPSARNGPTLPRARNITCEETPCRRSVPTTSAARSRAAVSSDDELRAEVQRGVRRGDLGRQDGSAQWPSGRRAAPKTCQSGGRSGPSTTSMRVDRHLAEPVRGRAEADALTLGEGQHPARLVGVDDPRAAVAHLPPPLQDLGHHLDPPDVAPGSRTWQEWITGFGTASRSDSPPPSGEAIPNTREQDAAGRIPHVAAERHGVVRRTLSIDE